MTVGNTRTLPCDEVESLTSNTKGGTTRINRGLWSITNEDIYEGYWSVCIGTSPRDGPRKVYNVIYDVTRRA